MMQVNFRIQDLADRDKVLFPEYEGQVGNEGELKAVGFLQGGTEAGKPSVVMLVDINGKMHGFQMTAAMYLSLAAGMKGAMERWGEPWDGA